MGEPHGGDHGLAVRALCRPDGGADALAGIPPSPTAWHGATWLALDYHLVFSICLAQMLWFRNVNRLTLGEATISTLIIPVIGVGSASLLLGEPLTLQVVMALLLILGAIAIVMLGRRPPS